MAKQLTMHRTVLYDNELSSPKRQWSGPGGDTLAYPITTAYNTLPRSGERISILQTLLKTPLLWEAPLSSALLSLVALVSLFNPLVLFPNLY